MTRYGLLLPANEAADPDLLRVIADHPTTAPPSVVPVWSRYTLGDPAGRGSGFRLDWSLLERIRAAGMEPVVYCETGRLQPAFIIAGQYDTAFRLLFARCRGALVRILHEGNGKGLFPWQAWPVPQYVDAFRHIATLAHEEGARIAYCVVGRNAGNDDMLDRWPGADAVDVVGFDRFKRKVTDANPPKQWRYAVERLTATGRPVWVFETGIDAALPNRGRWLASQADVVGVEAICTFDFLVTGSIGGHEFRDDWRFDSEMIAAWDGLPR